MRFEELRLIAYGPFTDRTLKLRPGLNVLYGPNEAGKSSALRAVHALLFGFGHKTSDNFLHHHQQLRVGAVLVDDKGERLACVRRKGRISTLRDGEDNEPIEESRLRTLLGDVTEEFFTTVFGIDQERLREGGEEVVKGEGRIGALLFAAGGVTHLREKQKALDEQAASLFKPNASNPDINKRLSQLKNLNDEIRFLQRSPEQWAEHDKEHRRLTDCVEDLTRELEEAESTRSRLGRIHSALGFLASWKTKRAELDKLAAVVMLPEDAEERFGEASRQQIVAEAGKNTAEGRIAEVQLELEAIETPTDLLGAADRIDALYLRLGAYRKDSIDRVELAAHYGAACDNAERALEKLGWQLSLDEAAKHRLPDEKKALVRKLSAQHGEVTRAAREEQQSLAKLEGRQAELVNQLAQKETAEFPTGLKDHLAAATSLLDVEDRMADRRTEVDRLTDQTEEALARLTRWEGTLEEACRLKTPSEATIDRFDESLRTLQTDAATLGNQVKENRSAAERVAQDLEALELAESVPTEGVLSELRALRDRGVSLAVRKLGGEKIESSAVDAFVGAVGEGESLATAIEPSVRHADAVADRLRRESERVAQKSQLLAKQASLAKQATDLAAQAQEAKTTRDGWDADWQACWQEAGVDPEAPAEMRSWLRRHEAALTLAASLRSAKATLSSDEERINRLQEALRGELRRRGVDTIDAASLRELHAEGQRRIDGAESALRERERLQADLDRTVAEARDAANRRQVAERELAAWKEAWADALLPLRLNGDALPEQAEAVLGNLDELFGALDERAKLGKRIGGIEETAEEFREEALAICAAVATDLMELAVDEIAATLNQRLSQAKDARLHETNSTKRLTAERQSLREAEQALAGSRAALDALVAQASCQRQADLPAALDASARKRRLAEEVEDLRSQLTPFCAGKPLEEFAAEAESEDADRLPSQMTQLDERIASLRTDRDEAIRAREETAGHLRQFGGESAAADKAAEREFLLAQLEADARDYAVTVVASRLLQRAVERYQEKAQGPVLAGASDYFAQLTCGSFDRLRPDLDEQGQPVLLGSRPDGSALPVQAMSEGTRDQLYLALRLGTVEYWLDQHGGVPMVVDDVLLTFDDQRAAACLAALRRLSQKTQVLVFTHHAHLVSLLEREVLPPDELACVQHLLPQPSVT